MSWQERVKKNLIKANNFAREHLSNISTLAGLGYKQREETSPEEKMLQEIWEAHEEWVNSINNFNYVSEPDLIEYSIYDIETKQKRYSYLIKQAKDQQIDVAPLRQVYDKI